MKTRSQFLARSTAYVMAFLLVAIAADIAHSEKEKPFRDRDRHEDVYRHRLSKDILPFAEILKLLRPRIKGEIIETEFEIEHGRPVYEFKYIDPAGRVMEIYVDAKTGKILKQEVDD